MQILGTHLLVELSECNKNFLNDLEKTRMFMVDAAKRAKATIIDERFHQFNPHGISGAVIIAESHLTIHTWPEYGYAAVDIFTCGQKLQPKVAADYLAKKFQSKKSLIKSIKRGIPSKSNKVLAHKPV